MEFNPINPRAHMAKVFIFIFILYFGQVAHAQTVDQPKGLKHIPVASQEPPDDAGHSLTAVVVKFAPGATAASHHHPGTVFSYVLEGTVRSLSEARLGHEMPAGRPHKRGKIVLAVDL